MTKPREFWIRPEGISKRCVYHAAVYTEKDLEIETNKEFILEGIHVIEYSALEKANARIEKLRKALNAISQESFWTPIEEISTSALIEDDEAAK